MSKDTEDQGAKAQEAEEGKAPNSVDVDKIKADIKAELEAHYQSKIDKLQSVINEKVEGKKELEKRLMEEAEARGDIESAKEMYAKELAEKESAISEMREQLSVLDELKAKAEIADKIQEERKAELLNMLPEAKREKYSKYSLDALRDIVEDLADPRIATNKNGSTHPGKVQADPKKMSFAEYFKARTSG